MRNFDSCEKRDVEASEDEVENVEAKTKENYQKEKNDWLEEENFLITDLRVWTWVGNAPYLISHLNLKLKLWLHIFQK